MLRRLRALLWDELVSNAMNGANKYGAPGIAFDLLPKLRDAVIHRSKSRALALWPCRPDQLLSRYDDLGSADQKLQHFEFPQRQINRLVRPAKFHRAEIQGEFPKTRHLVDI